MSKVLVVGIGSLQPSTIYRLKPLIPLLHSLDYDVDFCQSLAYPTKKSKIGKIAWLFKSITVAFSIIIRARMHNYTLIILQRHLVSRLPALSRLMPRKTILDVDDSVHLKSIPSKQSYFKALKHFRIVVVGNQFLENLYSSYIDSGKIFVIPTCVSFPSDIIENDNNSSIGWLGSPVNLKYLYILRDTFKKLVNDYPGLKIKICTNLSSSCFKDFLKFYQSLIEYFEFTDWYPQVEKDFLKSIAIGIMPLHDSEWERGKCGFKLLQYSSYSLPLVASPVGANKDIVINNLNGFLPNTESDWYETFSLLLNSKELCNELGKNARIHAEDFYSLEHYFMKWKSLILLQQK